MGSEYQAKACIGALQSEYQSDRNEIKREILSVTSGDTWESQDETGRSPPKLTRSPSCPRLYSTLSFINKFNSTSRSQTLILMRTLISIMLLSLEELFIIPTPRIILIRYILIKILNFSPNNKYI